jgi:hypothetical protein
MGRRGPPVRLSSSIPANELADKVARTAFWFSAKVPATNRCETCPCLIGAIHFRLQFRFNWPRRQGGILSWDIASTAAPTATIFNLNTYCRSASLGMHYYLRACKEAGVDVPASGRFSLEGLNSALDAAFASPSVLQLHKRLEGTSKNGHRSSATLNFLANDSGLFPFRFCAVHPKDAGD